MTIFITVLTTLGHFLALSPLYQHFNIAWNISPSFSTTCHFNLASIIACFVLLLPLITVFTLFCPFASIFIVAFVTFGVYIWFPANSVVSVWHSGPLWWVRQQRCLDSLVNIERQTLGEPSGSHVLLGRSW